MTDYVSSMELCEAEDVEGSRVIGVVGCQTLILESPTRCYSSTFTPCQNAT